MTKDEIKIRECTTVEEFARCVYLQKEVFATTDLENSPVRHFIVTKKAGGWTLGAFHENNLVGFVLTVPAFEGENRYFYSHMTAVSAEFQNYGIGAKLKWAQRTRALAEGINYIKWTFQPVQARNAFFNTERLGAMIKIYEPNFYGTDYSTSAEQNEAVGLDSDRIFADWRLDSPKVTAFSKGETFTEKSQIVRTIEIPNGWNNLVKANPKQAIETQTRIKHEFQAAFAENLICKGFERSETKPRYLLFKQ